MDEELASGIERAVFGAVGRDDIDAWLSRHLRARLGGDLSHIVFRSGRIAAVYGAALSDGRQGYEHGPWPQPHDPILDFTTTPPAFTWLADLARRAASVLNHAGPPDAVAHADWTCGNLRFHDGRVSCSYDWDSLAAAPEPVLVGLAAGCFTEGSSAGATTPTTVEVTGFLRDYEQVRSIRSAKPNNELPQPPSPGFWPTTHVANSACCLLAEVRLAGRRCPPSRPTPTPT